MEKQDETVDEKKRRLIEMTSAFCDARLDADYKRLCKKLINRMARRKPAPFVRGRLDIWAAGIVYALGSVNFLFDKSFPPHVSAGEIAEHFGVASGSASQKAAAIREMFDLHPLNREFGTKHMKEQFAPTLDMIGQMEALLGENLRPAATEASRSGGEFIDGDHAVMRSFYDLCERYEERGAAPKIESELRRLIERDPDFYDSYLMLRDILSEQGRVAEGDALLAEAYRRALARTLDRRGNWPRALEWGWLENRHIIRTFLNQAIACWEADDTDAALDLLRKLLRSNPNDNIGARNYLLAIRLGMTFEAFETTFGTELGYDGMKMARWFDKNSAHFPDEFDGWKQAVGYGA